MRVALDVGPVKAQPAGVGIYTRSLAVALANVVPAGDLALIGRRRDAAGLPDHVRSFGRSRRIPYPAWVELLGGIDARRAKGEVAHFTDGLVPVVRFGPTVVTVHDVSIVRHWRFHQFQRLPRVPLVLLAPHLATRVIADSQATADELIRLARIPARKIDVILLAPRPGFGPVPHEALHEVLGRHALQSGRFVLAPGTIEPRKNHVRLVEAFGRLVRERAIDDDVTLVIVGGEGWGAEAAVRAIGESPVTNRIRRLGYVPDEDLMALMTGAAVVTYVSTYEGFGLPILEAMACGAPVVTSNVSSMPEAAGDAGVLVDPFDSFKIARGIRDAMANPSLRAASRERASQFDWGTTAAATRQTYSDATR